MSLLGRTALLLALVAAIYVVVMRLASRRPGRRAWEMSAERGVYAVFGLTTLAIVTMWTALVTDAFELRNVAEYSSSTLGTGYKLTALWGSQAGSLLLWAWILSGYAAVVVYLNRGRNRQLMPVVMAVLMGIAIFFLGVLSFVTSPFETLAVVPEEGRGLNPLLQNVYMQIHPPLLYLGYVGLSVPFAFAIAALVTRKLDTSWITSVRRWTIVSWLFLGIGIVLGAKWAYETLGWGGYWAWDPVENAAFMPWLVATAFLHSVMVQERRGMLKVWNMVLVILTFTLCLFGTFLTRSGIIASVHAFGESTLGPFFLVFIIAVLVSSIALLVTPPAAAALGALAGELHLARGDLPVQQPAPGRPRVRGLLGHDVPDPLRGRARRADHGGAGLLRAGGVADRHRAADPDRRRAADRLAQVVARTAAAQVHGAAGGRRRVDRPAAAAHRRRRELAGPAHDRGRRLRDGLHHRRVLAGHPGAPRTRRRLLARGAGEHGRPQPAPLRRLHRPPGVVILFIGFAGSKAFSTEADIAIREGESASVAGYVLVNEGATRSSDDHKDVTSVRIGVFRGDDRVATLDPGIKTFAVDETRASQVAIDTRADRDFYLFLSQLQDDGLARISVFVNPLVGWIWFAGVMIVLGGLLAAWPGRPAERRERAASPAPDGRAPA